MILKHINQIPVIAEAHGAKYAVLSPGSRVAPLTLAFTRYRKIECFTLSDERSAAFAALGMAEASNSPVVIACTSGTAASNYIPAVTEAYYRQIPMVILTADRPPEWIDQWDGQTIRQSNLYSNHIKRSFELPVDTSHEDAQWRSNRIINEAFIEAKKHPCGPVHVNIPLREPFYPEPGEKFVYEKNVRIIENSETIRAIPENTLIELHQKYKQGKKILILAGQSNINDETRKKLSDWAKEKNIPVITDIISNCYNVETGITKADIFLKTLKQSEYAKLNPDLIISFGKSIISKNTKLYLRKTVNKKQEHWYVGINEFLSDPLQNLTRTIDLEIDQFLAQTRDWESKDSKYLELWRAKEEKTERKLGKVLSEYKTYLNELLVSKAVFESLPENSKLHLANSMPVRWANFISGKGKNINVIANRGTSGIDGTISTASGHAIIEPARYNVILTGDLSFFYDRNSLWHNYGYKNLCIVIMNNHSGGIFGLIDGPSKQPENKEWFETRQMLTAKNIARDHKLQYFRCTRVEQLQEAKGLINTSVGRLIIEIFTEPEENKKVFKALFQ
ncbi:2-succinyl-5-enolpyruvyl-6-hydroxy-3-cyclohexene-1-carboxylic-acid synthase [Mangrovivirga sp. M17]|uniref:2-succinyl-5-enolpyruvyl-6-hydroxy-3-cyclohexene-1-carboxylate synthase n=1 Tax=Mangrovivirga halotolerans TaxID=2993936 RepID=A0ABT3RVY1_9BACT|nr:2-succinyl-5-enolpyruvyl-6-hydroxy-3-cyclohexene-1-carboxylic-acid synthase [Mangrovivirga halotolerans]MCX2745686.1 2-succinyl-5-enolpyruvyl-6-hydroxy-3-cyclohexene-1-carboxylic-acid synthase [Mangrovivirga halotolerans]